MFSIVPVPSSTSVRLPSGNRISMGTCSKLFEFIKATKHLLSGEKSEMITSGIEKIYPTKVEDYLKTHPKIHRVAVTGVPDKVWGEVVTALIELKSGEEMTPEEVIEYCKDNIAFYKKPHIVKFVDQVPLTKIGKNPPLSNQGTGTILSKS